MVPENALLGQQIADLRRFMEINFNRVQEDLDEVKKDVKGLHQEAIPYRVKTLETWREGMSTRLWTFLIGCGVASGSAWIAVVFIQGQ